MRKPYFDHLAAPSSVPPATNKEDVFAKFSPYGLSGVFAPHGRVSESHACGTAQIGPGAPGFT